MRHCLEGACDGRQHADYPQTPNRSARMQEPKPKRNRGGPALAIPAFVIALFGIMLLAHFLAPDAPEDARSSSMSPIHRNR
jgi:hypothetical protein